MNIKDLPNDLYIERYDGSLAMCEYIIEHMPASANILDNDSDLLWVEVIDLKELEILLVNLGSIFNASFMPIDGSLHPMSYRGSAISLADCITLPLCFD